MVVFISLVARPFFILTFGGSGTQSKFLLEGRGQDSAKLYRDKTLHHLYIHDAMLVQVKREDLYNNIVASGLC